MFLVSKDRTAIINIEHKAIQAMKLLARRINTEKGMTVYVPADAELQDV